MMRVWVLYGMLNGTDGTYGLVRYIVVWYFKVNNTMLQLKRLT